MTDAPAGAKRLAQLRAALIAALGTLARFLSSALFWLVIFALLSAGFVCFGIYQLAGLPWASIAIGCFCVLATLTIGKGMSRG